MARLVTEPKIRTTVQQGPWHQGQLTERLHRFGQLNVTSPRNRDGLGSLNLPDCPCEFLSEVERMSNPRDPSFTIDTYQDPDSPPRLCQPNSGVSPADTKGLSSIAIPAGFGGASRSGPGNKVARTRVPSLTQNGG